MNHKTELKAQGIAEAVVLKLSALGLSADEIKELINMELWKKEIK